MTSTYYNINYHNNAIRIDGNGAVIVIVDIDQDAIDDHGDDAVVFRRLNGFLIYNNYNKRVQYSIIERQYVLNYPKRWIKAFSHHILMSCRSFYMTAIIQMPNDIATVDVRSQQPTTNSSISYNNKPEVGCSFSW